MATILAFKPASARHHTHSATQCRPASTTAPPTGEIVLFTGIRYERWDDDVDSLQSDASGHMTLRRDPIDVGD